MSKRTANKNETCIQRCAECARICVECSYHCLDMGGEHAGREHQRAMHDCAAICAMAMSFMLRESPHADHICEECAEICRACARSCERLAEGDGMMTRCAEICNECADACGQMAGTSR